MVRHIVMWNFKDGFTDEQNINNARKVKEELEALRALIPGIISLEVVISTLSSGNRDIVINTLFENEATLAEYQIHPEHVRVSQYVGAFVQNRTCADYYEG
jgi:hypothetical protein